jgi:hypothetical protein
MIFSKIYRGSQEKGLYKTIQNDPSLASRLLEKMSNRLRLIDKKIAIQEASN